MAIAFTRKKRIMICSLSKEIEIYNVFTYNLEMTIEGHSLGVTYASLFDDKNGVITSSNDNTMKIWNIYAHSYQLIGTINCGCLILQVLIFPHNIIISCSSSKGIIARTSFSPYKIIETEITNPPSFEVIKKIRNKYLFALSMEYSNCSLCVYQAGKKIIKKFQFDKISLIVNSIDNIIEVTNKVYICGTDNLYVINIDTFQMETQVRFGLSSLIPKTHLLLNNGNILFGSNKIFYLFNRNELGTTSEEEAHLGYITSLVNISAFSFVSSSNDCTVKFWKY